MYTNEQLTAMSADEVKDIAKGLGIHVGNSKVETLVKAILKVQEQPQEPAKTEPDSEPSAPVSEYQRAEIIQALLAGRSSDRAIQDIIVKCAAKVAKHGNTIAFAKDLVLPLLSYVKQEDEIDRRQLILNYIGEVCRIDYNPKVLTVSSVKLMDPKESYNREWLDKIKETPWTKKVATIKAWKDGTDSYISQQAVGLLLGEVDFYQLAKMFNNTGLATVAAKLRDRSTQKKAEEKALALGIEMPPVDDLVKQFSEVSQAIH